MAMIIQGKKVASAFMQGKKVSSLHMKGKEVSLSSGTGGGAAPIITTQPSDVTVHQGDIATLSVVVTGATRYQWKSRLTTGLDTNWYPIVGATAATYIKHDNSLLDNGHAYMCTASNTHGSVDSHEVEINVIT